MAEFNAADTRAIRAREKAARQLEAERDIIVANLMSSPGGRTYIHDLLRACHVFDTSFNLSGLAMAFAEGERNVGLRILADVMRCAPDQYIQMMREVNDREHADRRSRSGENTNGRDPELDLRRTGESTIGIHDDYDVDLGEAEPS